MVVRKIPKKKKNETNQAERSGFSESRGRETLNFKFWAQSELKKKIGKIRKFDIFCNIFVLFINE